MIRDDSGPFQTLRSLIDNGKFYTANQTADALVGIDDRDRELIAALSATFGNIGTAGGGHMGTIIGALVAGLLGLKEGAAPPEPQ